MSEQAPEAPPGGGGGGGGNVFKRKIGPLPMWAWLAIGAAIIGLYVIWRRNQASQAATASTSTPASDVPQFVNQTYTTVTPPPAPTTTSTGTTGTTGTGGGTTGKGTPPPVVRPKQITASGADTGDINQIAKLYGLTEQELIRANPGLRKLKVRSPNGKTIPLIGSGAPIPKGTVVKIPPVPAKAA